MCLWVQFLVLIYYICHGRWYWLMQLGWFVCVYMYQNDQEIHGHLQRILCEGLAPCGLRGCKNGPTRSVSWPDVVQGD